MILDVLHLMGASWMDPQWWLDHFGQEFFWVSAGIIFAECGLFFPFLPGDTLLFALGLFISGDKLNVVPGGHGVDLIASLVILSVAAFLGNVVGHEIGRKLGRPLYDHAGRILKRKYLDKTSAFFDRHGNKALVIGRFVPFVRTYITVVAGVTEMNRRRFFVWSAVGALAWVISILLMGYFLGAAFPAIGKNIDYAVIAIAVFTVIPLAFEAIRHRGHDDDDEGDERSSATAERPAQG